MSVVELGLQEPLGGICDAVVKQKIKAIALLRGKVPPGIVTLVSVVKRVSLNTVELDEFTIEKKMLFAPGVAFGLTSIALKSSVIESAAFRTWRALKDAAVSSGV